MLSCNAVVIYRVDFLPSDSCIPMLEFRAAPQGNCQRPRRHSSWAAEHRSRRDFVCRSRHDCEGAGCDIRGRLWSEPREQDDRALPGAAKPPRRSLGRRRCLLLFWARAMCWTTFTRGCGNEVPLAWLAASEEAPASTTEPAALEPLMPPVRWSKIYARPDASARSCCSALGQCALHGWRSTTSVAWKC